MANTYLQMKVHIQLNDLFEQDCSTSNEKITIYIKASMRQARTNKLSQPKTNDNWCFRQKVPMNNADTLICSRRLYLEPEYQLHVGKIISLSKLLSPSFHRAETESAIMGFRLLLSGNRTQKKRLIHCNILFYFQQLMVRQVTKLFFQ